MEGKEEGKIGHNSRKRKRTQAESSSFKEPIEESDNKGGEEITISPPTTLLELFKEAYEHIGKWLSLLGAPINTLVLPLVTPMHESKTIIL